MAFSSVLWANATNKYATKIMTLMGDVWKELMREARTYMAFTWGSVNKSLVASDPYATGHDCVLFSDEE